MRSGANKMSAIVGGLFACVFFSNVGMSAVASGRGEEPFYFSLKLNDVSNSDLLISLPTKTEQALKITAGNGAFSSISRLAQPAKHLFELPEYPGTVPFNENPSMKRLQLPFATSLLVYKTADNGRLDKEKVIAFYRRYLESKGWKDDIFKRRGDEGYLGLGVNLFENLADGTRIQLSGNFYLWVAPQDGIYSILLNQWRLSSPDQHTLNRVSKFVGSLEGIGAKHNYRVQKVYSDGEWYRDYENEYLIDRVRFMFIADKSAPPHPSADQMIDLVILTYRDSAIAEDAAGRLRGSATNLSDGGQILSLPSTSVKVVVVRNKNVLLVRGYSEKQREAVTQIAADFEKL